jgi:hypothetical protein
MAAAEATTPRQVFSARSDRDDVRAQVPLPNCDFRITTAQLAVWQKMMPTQSYPVGKLDRDRIVVTPQ